MPEQRMDIGAQEIIGELRTRLSDAHYEMAVNAVVIRKLQAANAQLTQENGSLTDQLTAVRAATAPQTVRREVAVPVPLPAPPMPPAGLPELSA